MQKTEHYALNQWDLSDRIMMEDFNADNAKVDAALNSLHEANRYVHLKTIVTQEEVSRVDVDLSNVDWSVYPQLIITVKGEGVDTVTSQILMNGDAETHYRYRDALGNTQNTSNAGYFNVDYGIQRNFSRLTITGACSKPQCDIFQGGEALTASYYYYGSDGTGIATLEELNFLALSGSFKSGLTIAIYGVKF